MAGLYRGNIGGAVLLGSHTFSGSQSGIGEATAGTLNFSLPSAVANRTLLLVSKNLSEGGGFTLTNSSGGTASARSKAKLKLDGAPVASEGATLEARLDSGGYFISVPASALTATISGVSLSSGAHTLEMRILCDTASWSSAIYGVFELYLL